LRLPRDSRPLCVSRETPDPLRLPLGDDGALATIAGQLPSGDAAEAPSANPLHVAIDLLRQIVGGKLQRQDQSVYPAGRMGNDVTYRVERIVGGDVGVGGQPAEFAESLAANRR